MQQNLARKWRSKRFDELIGQEMTVRIIKNTLYRQSYFPVYLLSGKHGCGKTTVGRLFAAALNCAELATFIEKPQSVSLPCNSCQSCLHMISGDHADFIEIDAASYTGVDNVRSIIETASFLPVLGRKKVYLIDEAHMLSKSAFNAFLKILEEPPATALFMLATTEPHKILDTVRSRCFQLFFDPVPAPALSQHLAHICDAEKIAYEPDALVTIAHETGGSVRDAINCVERIMLATGGIQETQVRTLLRIVDDRIILELLNAAARGDRSCIINTLADPRINELSISGLWRRMVELLRDAVWAHYKNSPHALAHIPVDQLISWLELWYHTEGILLKTESPLPLCTYLFLKMCVTAPRKEQPVSEVTVTKAVPLPEASWYDHFLNEMAGAFSEPLVVSLFRKSRIASSDQKQGAVQIIFSKDAEFFAEWIEKTRSEWTALLHKAAGKELHVSYIFDSVAQPQPTKASIPNERPKSTPAPQVTSPNKNNSPQLSEQAQRLLALFPGTIHEIPEVLHEQTK